MSWIREVSAVLVLVALWAVPVAAVAWALPLAGEREADSVAPELPTTVTVGSRSTDYRTSVTVTVELGEAPQVRSQVAGLLTEVGGAGPVSTGQQLFAVDGVPVLALRGDSPLYRELRPGARGADVEVLSRFLAELTLLPPDRVDDSFGPSVRAAVVRLQERLGVPQDGVFRPGYVAYVPTSVTALGAPLLPVAGPVAAGDPVLGTAAAPVAVRFDPTSPDASLTNLGAGPLTLRFGDVVVAVSGLQPAASELPGLYAELQQALAVGTAQRTGGQPGEAGGSSTPTGAGESEQYAGGLLARAEPEVRGVVPGTALHVSASGVSCLFVQGEDDEPAPRTVPVPQAAVGELGALFVDIDLVDAVIVRDPGTLTEAVRDRCR